MYPFIANQMTVPALNSTDIISYLSRKSKDASAKSTYQPPTKVSTNSTRPRLFALIIGINFYDNAPSLRGAVADARAFKDYLETFLDVPEDQIQFLLNKLATRSSILSGFARLRDDPRIEKGDPIFVFYAGHGSEVAIDYEEGKIQVLVPQDYCDDPGKTVPPIPDRTVESLLSQIADEKGNNITVIFDCCHSASGTRGHTTSTLVRSVDLQISPLSSNIDSDIRAASRSYQPANGSLHNGLSSHILIAACSSSEKAQEHQGRGSFSTALLKLLHTVPAHELQYTEILSHMDQIPGQNPQCEGANPDRYLFDAKVPPKEFLGFSLSIVQNEFVLGAGAIHGITKGAEFSFYASTDLSLRTPLGRLVVKKLEPFSAIMKPLTPIDVAPAMPSVIAVQTNAGEREDVRFYCPKQEEFLVCYEALVSVMESMIDKGWNIALVDSSEDAHVEIAVDNRKFIFLIKDRTITQYGVTRLFYDVPPVIEEIAPVIKAAAHFFWTLNRTNNNPTIMNDIQIEIYKLEQSFFDINELGQPLMQPTGPNLCQDNMVDLVVEGADVPYGMKLTNNSSYDFYPNLFYFDNSDLSIGSYYQSPPNGGKYVTDVPLKKNGGTLTIGYGSGGSPPFSYYLRDTQNHDLGFLKLFLSTQPIDLSVIPQRTPFEGRRSLENPPKPTGDVWGTILLPAIQRRYPAATSANACSQCGFVAMPGFDIEYLQIQNEDLKCELEIQHKTASREKQKLEDEYRDILAKVEQGKAELAELTKSFEQESHRRKGDNLCIPPTVQTNFEANPAPTHPQINSAPRAMPPSRKLSLSERVKRLLRLRT